MLRDNLAKTGTYGGNITSDNITAHHLMNVKRVAYETKPLSMPRNGTTWRPSIYHDWKNRDASYTKALSSDVSRKGSQQNSNVEPQTKSVSADQKGKTYGSSAMTAEEVDQVVDEFIRSRS